LLIPLPEDYTDKAMVTWVFGVIDALYPLASSTLEQAH